MDFTNKRYLDYVHMNIKRLDNIIKILEYEGNIKKSNKLLRVYDKRVKERYNPEISKKNKIKMLTKYKSGKMK